MYQIIGPNPKSKVCQIPVKNLATNNSLEDTKMGVLGTVLGGASDDWQCILVVAMSANERP